MTIFPSSEPRRHLSLSLNHTLFAPQHFVLPLFFKCILGYLQVVNGPYAWLRQTCQFHHQAPVVCKQNSSHLHSLCEGILFNPTTLSIHWCKTSQLYNFNSRRGNEIFRFGVSLYKGHWCSVSCSSCFFFFFFDCLALLQVVYTHPVGYSFTYRRCSDGCQNVLRGLG